MLEHPVVFPFLRSSTDNDTRGRSKTLFPVEMGLNLFQFCANFYESELEWPPNSLCQHQSNAYVLYYNLSDVSIMEYIHYEFLPLLQCFFCVNCRSQICHTVPFNWKALGSKMPFCHPAALMLWIIWEEFAKAQIPQILLLATSATLQTWQKKVFSRTSSPPSLISISKSESTAAQKLINI